MTLSAHVQVLVLRRNCKNFIFIPRVVTQFGEHALFFVFLFSKIVSGRSRINMRA